MRVAFTIETTIERPREEVFSFVTDPRNLSKWDPRVVEARAEGGGPLREGSRIREVRKAGPRRVEQTVRVAALAPPERFDLRIEKGPIPVHGDLRFQTAGGGASTLVRLSAHGEPGGPQFLAPLFTALGRRTMRSQYRRLKRLLEDGGR